MPEAPEVQTVLDTLAGMIKDQSIEEIRVSYRPILSKEDEEKLIDQHFRSFYRIGKYLGFEMDDVDLIVHLRMEGKFYVQDDYCDEKHIHVQMRLSNGKVLAYHDTRKFGRMNVYEKVCDKHSLPAFAHVGKDVFDEELDYMELYHAFHGSKRPIKTLLLDQSIMAGIGNIYADEILFRCKLDPRSKGYRLSKQDCKNILYYARYILAGAMKAGGTTIRSYTSSLGVTGRFQLELRVHQQKGLPCPVCGQTIEKISIGQRGTYFCKKCQKRK